MNEKHYFDFLNHFFIFRFAAERTSDWLIGLITFDTEQVNVFDVFDPSRGRGEFTVKTPESCIHTIGRFMHEF